MPAALRTAPPHVALAESYVSDVLSGKAPACRWVKLACQRHLNDLAANRTKSSPFLFDHDAAEKACSIVEHFPHIKGIWARQRRRIELQPWQCFVLSSIFGWKVRETELRRFRTSYIECPRKNAKSTITSAVGLMMLACDDEAGSYVVSAAKTRDQAKLVFEDAQAMARRESGFRARYGVDVLAHVIAQPSTGSKFEALCAEDSNLDGRNVHCALIDELHAHPSRGLWDVLETATGSRAQSLLWAITTAGSNQASVCYEQRQHVTRILEGVVKDESYFGIVYTVDDDDDIWDELTWQKANPNYGISIWPDTFRPIAARAQVQPSAQVAFLTKHLNIWVNADQQWLPYDAWAKCADPRMTLADFEGESCYIGIDLALSSDIAAVMLLFPPAGDRDYYAVFGRYYLPQLVIERPENKHYQGWEREGLMTETEGSVTDFDYILDTLNDYAGRFHVIEIADDPWKNTPLVNHLQQRGITVPIIDVRPTEQMTTSTMCYLERLVMQQRIRHTGDPVLSWMMSNVVAHRRNPNVMQARRESSEKKIDGVMAILEALDRAMKREPGYAYEEGLVVL